MPLLSYVVPPLLVAAIPAFVLFYVALALGAF